MSNNQNNNIQKAAYENGYETGCYVAHNKIYNSIVARIKDLKFETLTKLSRANDPKLFKQKILAYSDILTFMKDQF